MDAMGGGTYVGPDRFAQRPLKNRELSGKAEHAARSRATGKRAAQVVLPERPARADDRRGPRRWRRNTCGAYRLESSRRRSQWVASGSWGLASRASAPATASTCRPEPPAARAAGSREVKFVATSKAPQAARAGWEFMSPSCLRMHWRTQS